MNPLWGFTAVTLFLNHFGTIDAKMKILDALTPEAIIPDLKSRDKLGILQELATPVARSAKIAVEDIVRVLRDRERLGSTGIGGGIGIPHGKLRGLNNLLLGFGISRQGVDFESIDHRPTHIFFLLITPENSTGLHLKVLARISRILKNEPFKARLLEAPDAAALYAILAEEDEDF